MRFANLREYQNDLDARCRRGDELADELARHPVTTRYGRALRQDHADVECNHERQAATLRRERRA